jgi:hypothetical protein
MSFQNLVRLSQIKNFSLPDYAHVNSVKKLNNLCQLMSYNMMLGYDFTIVLQWSIFHCVKT